MASKPNDLWEACPFSVWVHYSIFLSCRSLPNDTEQLDLSRQYVSTEENLNLPEPLSHLQGQSLIYQNLSRNLAETFRGMYTLQFLDLTGNNFIELNTTSLSKLEFLSEIKGLEIASLTANTFLGLEHLQRLELRTSMVELPSDVFQYLQPTEVTLELDSALTVHHMILDPISNSLKELVIHGAKLRYG